MIIGIGIDIIEIERIKKSIDTLGDSFLNRIFTQNEIDYCIVKPNRYQHFAARFAAKEAIYKSLANEWKTGVTWKSIEITNEKNGLPVVKFFDKLKEFISEDKEIKISISHSENYVTSVAIMYRKLAVI